MCNSTPLSTREEFTFTRPLPPPFVSFVGHSSSLFCDDVNDYLDAPVPLESDTVIKLDDIGQLECPTPQSGSEELAEVLVRGGALTLSSESKVR